MWNPTPNWQQTGSFADPVPIPASDPSADPQVGLCINVSWLPYLIGALMQLVQPTTWDTTDPTALFNVQTAAIELIERFGTAGSCVVLSFRFDDSCVLQYSTDGGVTWTDTPGWSTFSPACFTGPVGPAGPAGPAGPTGPPGTFTPGVPPNPGGDTVLQQACNIAAYLATDLIKASIQQTVSSIMASETVFNTVLAIVALIPGVDVTLGLMLGAGAVLFDLISGGTLSDYTSALADASLWSAVQCAIYDQISGTGYVTDANFAGVVTALGAIPYTPSDVVSTIHDYVNNLGAAGLEAIQLSGSLYVGDCSACGEWCYGWGTLGPTALDVDWSADNYGGGEPIYTGGVWQSVYVAGTPPFSDMVCSIQIAFTSTYLISIEVDYSDVGGGDCTDRFVNTNGDTDHCLSLGGGTHLDTIALGGPVSNMYISVRTRECGPTDFSYIKGVRLRGTGTNPFGSSNCI